MSMVKINKKRILRVVSFFLVFTVLLSTVGCGKNNETVEIISFSKEDAKDVYPSPVENLHVTDATNLKEIAKSGLVTLFIDDSTYSVAVLETLAQKYWYSLPLLPPEYDGGYDYSAAPVTLTVVNGSETIYLNSQDNSVAFGNAAYVVQKDENKDEKDKKKINGVTVHYIVTVDEKTAKTIKENFDITDITFFNEKTAEKIKNNLGKTDLAFFVSLKYTLKDGSLSVSCDTQNLSKNENAKITDLGILECLGASTGAEPGDFMLVPDSGGALINTAIEQPDFEKMSFVVYGDNLPGSATSDEKSAVIGAYGIKNGESALAVLIESGDAIAKISADRVTGSSGLNKVGAGFNTTQCKDIMNRKTISRYISRESYTGEIRLSFRFLSGSNATYSGMAAVCREQLIRANKLSTKTVETGEYLPFNLTVVGAIQKNLVRKIPLQSTMSLTTFEQAQDMLSRLKAKDVNSVFLRYKGALSGGLDQNDIFKAKVLRSLGGEKGLAELNDYMLTQKMNLFLDINILSTGKRWLLFDSSYGKTIFGEDCLTQTKNELSDYVGDGYFSQRLRPISAISDAVLKVLTTFRNTDIEGFCLNDASKTLYSDFSKEPYSRPNAATEIAEQITALSTGRKMMADTGNFYAIKNINVIFNIPMSLTITDIDNPPYQPVPFIQLILHGIIDYSGAPINETFNPDEDSNVNFDSDGKTTAEELFFDNDKNASQKELKDAMLRYIEYGACPSYEWSYKELSKTKSIETYYFDDWVNQAVDFYLKANAALADLRGARMVKHSQIKPGVFCAEYEGSSRIYVNYTTGDVDVGGIIVKARDFIRIY